MESYAGTGDRDAERGYFVFGDERCVVRRLLSDRRFTGQQFDETGLYYYNARYYDPETGHFISPDTLVPEPGNVLAYNRYMYALGNPLKYSDPSGFYSNDEIMQHYGCSDWACVENMFGDDGQYAGMWGWLQILQQAEDGYSASAGSVGAAGRIEFSGVFQRNDVGIISVANVNWQFSSPGGQITGGQIAAPMSDLQFASAANHFDVGNFTTVGGGNGYGAQVGQKYNHITFNPSQINKQGLALAALSAGSDFGPMIIAAAPATGPASPFVAASGVAYTVVGATTDLIVNVVIPINEAMNGNTGPAWESIAVEGASRLSGKAGPFIGPLYDTGKSLSPAICYGTHCR